MAKPKKGLTGPKSGKELRDRVLAEYSINGTAALALLDTAAAALDQALEAESILAKDGLVTGGTRGARQHPCVNISRDARNRLLAALRQLGVELT